MSSEPLIQPSDLASESRQCGGEVVRIFEELPKATIVSVSRPETGEISPILLSYTIELQYKQFKWHLRKKASQVLYLQFALRKRAMIEGLHDKQEQVKDWLQSLGIVDHTVMVQDDDEPDDVAVPLHHEDSVKNRYVPSIAALSIIRPALGGQQSICDRAKVAMQSYLDLFLGNLEIVNSREVTSKALQLTIVEQTFKSVWRLLINCFGSWVALGSGSKKVKLYGSVCVCACARE